MYGTPRLRSAFPQTPRHEPGSEPGLGASTMSTSTSTTGRRSNGFSATPSNTKRRSVIRPGSVVDATPPAYRANNPNYSGPQIPEPLLDAPTQRFLTVALAAALLAWKAYDWLYYSGSSQVESTWLFLKWCFIDGIFLVMVPILRIPWLEFSIFTTLAIWTVMIITNFWFMFNLSLPYAAVGSGIVRVFYNRELSLSNTRVDPGHLIDRAEIILGKQIINLLPEGSAILNPERLSYCLDDSIRTISFPLQINQTSPEAIEILRFDIDVPEQEPELITIGAKQARKLKKEADKGHDKSDTTTPRLLQIPVSKKGLYRLQKVMDQSKLEVRRRSHDVAVVNCPKATVTALATNKCMGDLSGVSLQLTGVPPFKVKYKKRINGHQYSSITQTVQSTEQDDAGIVIDPKRPQVGWTQSRQLSFDINESLAQNGTWVYSVEEVVDGLQNKVSYEEAVNKKQPLAKISQDLTVHKRPGARLTGCDSEKFLRVAREDKMRMPLSIRPSQQLPASDWPLKLKYTFVPEVEGATGMQEYDALLPNERDMPYIGLAGRYDLVSIESQFCAGEVVEPSSCLLYNPPRPSLNYQIEEIFDKCAGRPIGTIVNFDFTGTPPFTVQYSVTETNSGKKYQKAIEFDSMRGQIELREKSAGHYRYELLSISDEIYTQQSIKSSENAFEQSIRPPAAASFKHQGILKACLSSPVSAEVRMLGQGPWDLEYELVHAGKRKKFSLHADAEDVTIEVPPQSTGGRYTLVLTGVQDSSRCRTALKDERHIEIRPEQPRAAFGDINGKRVVQALEGKNPKLPIKLQGVAPWSVKIQQPDGEKDYVFKDVNSAITANHAGIYQLLMISDSCPGVIDLKANKFEVSWVKRPELSLRDATIQEAGNRIFRKQAVCRGDEDSIGLLLSGHSPFHIKYQVVHAEAGKGHSAVSEKPLSIASNSASIVMDTFKAGEYTYTFNELGDDRYKHDRKHFAPLTVKQQVYALPSARFTKTDKKPYGYCKDESTLPDEVEHENIPIALTGVPPFSLDIAVRHHGQAHKPEIIRIKDILSNTYSWSLSRASLGLGLHAIEIRKVTDARGCETLIESSSASQIRVQVSSPPKILPLDTRTDYCVGDHLAFSLSGQAPFDIFYKFHGKDRKAHINSHEFRRISDQAGDFVVTAIEDSVPVGKDSKCRAKQDIHKTVHPYPTVRISHGKTLTTDIHEGGEVEIVFEFTGTPPFEFTYTRSENIQRGKTARVLETKHDSSSEFVKVVRASDEGTYEVVSIKDRYCSYAAPSLAKMDGKQKLLT